jgi:hypothetical protein
LSPEGPGFTLAGLGFSVLCRCRDSKYKNPRKQTVTDIKTDTAKKIPLNPPKITAAKITNDKFGRAKIIDMFSEFLLCS